MNKVRKQKEYETEKEYTNQGYSIIEREQLKKEIQLKSSLEMKTVLWDVDDVLLNSNETVIKILNERYNIQPPKKSEDLKDWGFQSIHRGIKKEEIYKIYESEEFWNRVQVNEQAIEILKDSKLNYYYHWIIGSKGTKKNLEKKKQFLIDCLEERGIDITDIEFQFLEINGTVDDNETSKKRISVPNGIQIDDNYYSLNTNAKTKVLLKNNRETNYNYVPDLIEDLYIINTLDEFKEILEFIIKTEQFLDFNF